MNKQGKVEEELTTVHLYITFAFALPSKSQDSFPHTAPPRRLDSASQERRDEKDPPGLNF